MSLIKRSEKNSTRKRISGQGMTEYIIIVALIAIAAIAAVSFFGKTIQGSFSGLAASLTGDATKIDAARTTTEKAADETEGAVAAKTLKDYNK